MRERNLWMIVITVLIVCAQVIVALTLRFLPAPGRVGTSVRTQVTNNFKQITIGMHNYAQVHGALPPPAIYSKDGKPLLSWRVAILPYIEEEALYKQFKLDQPWDSPANLALLPKMSAIYHDHTATLPPGMTTFRVFVGPGTAFEGPHGTPFKDFPDGTSNTLLVVEAAEAVPWTKPAELAYGPECSLPPLGGRLPKHFMAGFGDASVRSIEQPVAEEHLRAAITRNGAERLGLQE